MRSNRSVTVMVTAAGVLAICLAFSVGQAAGSSDLAPTAPLPSSSIDPSLAAQPAPAGSVTSTGLRTAACASGKVCYWPATGFSGIRQEADCNTLGGGGYFYILGQGLYYNSAKNRCANRKAYLGNALAQTACLDPGENRPNISDSDRSRIGIAGSNCP